MSSAPGLLQRLWFRWRSLNLPWRRRWLRGFDLAGNTFWEFKDHYNSNRLRRIVKYNPRTHYGDIKITPQWHQWLRHTREEAPSIQEQRLDEIRQEKMKQLAAAADERWASKPSLLDPPEMRKPAPAMAVKDPGGYAGQTEPEQREGVRNAVAGPDEVQDSVDGRQQDSGRLRGETRERSSPFSIPKGGPTAEWQPEAWVPSSKR